jgi:hypothetical protein
MESHHPLPFLMLSRGFSLESLDLRVEAVQALALINRFFQASTLDLSLRQFRMKHPNLNKAQRLRHKDSPFVKVHAETKPCTPGNTVFAGAPYANRLWGG